MTKQPCERTDTSKNMPAVNRRMRNSDGLPDLVTILIPTLNEVDNIDRLIERIIMATENEEFSIEIVFVDGGSKDGTQKKVLEWQTRGPVRLVESDGRGGLAGDILYGAANSRTDVVVVMDADMSHPPEALPALIHPVLAGTQDMTIGSRYVPGGGTPGWSWIRRLTSGVATILAWPLVSIRDPMSGFFAVKRERLLSLGKEATGFKIAMEVAAKGSDSLRILEVPITFVDRERGKSKFGTTEIVSCLRQMFLLAGGAAPAASVTKFALVGSMGVFVDYLVFTILLSGGVGVVPSHISSFIAATIFNYFLNARWTFSNTARLNGISQWRLYPSFLSVCVLALLFRGAVLWCLTESAGWSPRIAIFFAIGAAAVINFVGSAFFVFPQKQTRTTPSIQWRVLALSAALYAVLIRLAFMGTIDLIPEEAYYWNYALRPDLGYLDHPPMVAWLIWLGTHIAGKSEAGVRLMTTPLWCVAAFFMYGLAKNLFGKTTAFITVMFLAVLPIYFSTGFLMLPDTALYPAWAGCVFFVERAALAGHRRAWLWAGVCLGLGMLAKYTAVLLVPAIFLFVAIDKESRQWLKRPQPYAALLLACAIFSPVIAWNSTHNWASFAFQGVERWSGSTHVAPHLLVASILVLLTPIGFVAAIRAFIGGQSSLSHSPEGVKAGRKRFFLIMLTAVPLAVFFLSSFFKAPRLHWTGPVWLPILPLVANALATSTGMASSGWLERFSVRAWKPTVVCLLLIYGGFMYYLLVGAPGLSPSLALKVPVAWKEAGVQLAALEERIESETSKSPLVAGMDLYQISSQLAFYIPDPYAQNRISGRHLFGRNSLMWNHWYPASGASGKTIIVVSDHEDNLSDGRLANYFESIGPIGQMDIEINRRPTARLYYRVGCSYKDTGLSAQ